MRWFQWIDRNLWSVPVIVFLSVWAATVLWSAASSKPVLLAAAAVASRQAVYSSLTGSAGAFFAAALAVVAILVVFAISRRFRRRAHSSAVDAATGCIFPPATAECERNPPVRSGIRSWQQL